MKSYLCLPLYEPVVREAVVKLHAHVAAYIAEVERLQVAVPHGMEEYQYGHHLAVGHEAWTVETALARGVQRVYFQLGTKYLQNSSRIQKISIKFASIMGMDVLFYVTY